MDDIDRQIVALLRQDARRSFLSIGLHVSLSAPAVNCEGRMAAAEVRDAVEHHPEVEAAYTVAGEASAMLHVRARDTSHLEEALERIRDHAGVTRTQTQIVLSTLFERPFDETQP